MSKASSPTVTTSSSTPLTAHGFHHFKIKDYSICNALGKDNYVASDTFMVGGHSWEVRFYPCGISSQGSSEHNLFYVALASEATNVKAFYGFSFINEKKYEHKVHAKLDCSIEGYTFKCRGDFSGYDRFSTKSTSTISSYLKDDALELCCSIGILKSHNADSKFCTISVPPSNIGQHLRQLIESGKGADVSFVVDGQTFAAHKLILAARSPVFQAQFFGPKKDHNTINIEVEDMQASIFKALLHFIYWDSLPDMQEPVAEESKCASSLFTHLLVAADRYDIERLRLLCGVKLCEELSINRFTTILSLAEQYNIVQLKRSCFNFIKVSTNLRAFMQTEGYEYLKKNLPSVLFELFEHFTSG